MVRTISDRFVMGAVRSNFALVTDAKLPPI